MIVCLCHRVSDRDIAQAAREGCASFEELQDELCVATACGACHDCARDTFREHVPQCGAWRLPDEHDFAAASAAPVGAASVRAHAARVTVIPRLVVAQDAGA